MGSVITSEQRLVFLLALYFTTLFAFSFLFYPNFKHLSSPQILVIEAFYAFAFLLYPNFKQSSSLSFLQLKPFDFEKTKLIEYLSIAFIFLDSRSINTTTSFFAYVPSWCLLMHALLFLPPFHFFFSVSLFSLFLLCSLFAAIFSIEFFTSPSPLPFLGGNLSSKLLFSYSNNSKIIISKREHKPQVKGIYCKRVNGWGGTPSMVLFLFLLTGYYSLMILFSFFFIFKYSPFFKKKSFLQLHVALLSSMCIRIL